MLAICCLTLFSACSMNFGSNGEEAEEQAQQEADAEADGSAEEEQEVYDPDSGVVFPVSSSSSGA